MKKICFIDIEANQLYGRSKNFILEFSIYTEQIIKKIECNHKYKIKNKIKYLLNLKDHNYYKNIKLSEKDCYKQLLEYDKEYHIYTYGNYDQVVLNDVAKRYKLNKIKLIDYSKHITKILKINKNCQPSIRSLRFALNINLENIIEHDSLSDVKVLKSIYDKVKNLNEDQKKDIKQKLDYELLRPKLNVQDCYAKYVKKTINDNYTISILEIKILDPIIKKIYINKDIDEYVESIIANRREEYTLTIYDNKANLLDKRIVTINKEDDRRKPIKTTEAIKMLNLDLNNTVLICNKGNKKIFERKEEQRIFNVVNCISLNTYQRYKLKINNLINIINMFYENNKFDKVVDYSLINLYQN